MRLHDFEIKLSWLLAIGGAVTSSIVLAWNASEPVNAPKMLILAATGVAAAFFLSLNTKQLDLSLANKSAYLTTGLFILFAVISTTRSKSPITTSFFGVWGRNTGLLTYLSLALILVAASQIKSSPGVERVLDGLYYAGLVNVFYFIFTLFGVELIPWNNVYKRVLGTFGNPNFVGAFMGLFVLLCVVRTLDKSRSVRNRVFTIFLIPLAFWEIKNSLASQGVAIAALGLAILGFFYLLWNVKSRIPIVIYSVFCAALGLTAVGGVLQKGPLADIIYKSSVSFRGEYWAAGIKMGINNLLSGVGLDSYGTWYRFFRSEGSLISPGKDVTTNTAHNVYIDIFASGGLPLLLVYCVLTALALVKIVAGIRRIREFDHTFVALVILWTCYQVQSIVSINQIGIAIWGWILSGLMIGYKVSREDAPEQVENLRKISKSGRSALKEKQKISVAPLIVGGILGLVIASPPYISDVNWRTTLRDPNVINLEQGAKSWPLTPERIVQASEIYTKNNVADKGLELAKFATEEFPSDFRVWYFYYMNPNISAEEKSRVREILAKQDPFNQDFR